MQKNSDIQNELLIISKTIAAIPNVNVYSLPEGYFEDFSTRVLSSIKSLPSYSLHTNIKDSQTYSIPVNYFDSLADEILFKIKKEKEVISLPLRNKVLRFSIAAVAIALLGLSLTAIIKHNRIMEEENNYSAYVMQEANRILISKSFEDNLNSLEEEDVIKYLQDNGLDVNAALVASLSDEKETFLKDDDFYDGETLVNYLHQLKITGSTIRK